MYQVGVICTSLQMRRLKNKWLGDLPVVNREKVVDLELEFEPHSQHSYLGLLFCTR
jgi:hypothetical protein